MASLEHYERLATRELIKEPLGLLSQRLFFRIKTFFQVLFRDNHTELEKLLLQDKETFTSALTSRYSNIDKVEGFGEIYNVVLPHPLKNSPNKETQRIIEKTPVIVFIHGLGGNLQQFDEQLIRFQGISDLIAFDLPGSGHSTCECKLTLNNLTQSVISLLSKRGYSTRDLILVSHSYGTQIALELIGLIPEKIRGVVLLAPPNPQFKRTFFQISVLKLFRSVPIVFDIFRKFDRLNNVQSHSLRRLFANKEVDSYYKFKQLKFNLSTMPYNILTQALEWVPLPVEYIIAAYEHNDGNILILEGDQDKVTKNGGELLKKNLLTNAEYHLIDKAGHNLTLDSFEVVNDYLETFFMKVDPNLNKTYIKQLQDGI